MSSLAETKSMNNMEYEDGDTIICMNKMQNEVSTKQYFGVTSNTSAIRRY